MQPSTDLAGPGTLIHLARRDLARYQRLDSTAVIRAMRASGCEHLVHYAGAAGRDLVAWHLCAAWLADPQAQEHVLKAKALKAACGWDVAPEAFLAAGSR